MGSAARDTASRGYRPGGQSLASSGRATWRA
jgi:hypothetical protein